MDVSMMDLFQPENLIRAGGLALLLLIVFAETGLFFGFFLPGDSLLFVAGLLSGSRYLPAPLWLTMMLVIIAAASGTTVGYGFGYWAKAYLRKRKENLFYRKRYLDITKDFYSRYGMMTFIIGRFLPVVRTFIPILAGIVRIDFTKFFVYNVVGAVIWTGSFMIAGHWLGNAFPAIINHLDIIVAGMILVSSVPIVTSWLKYRRSIVKNVS